MTDELFTLTRPQRAAYTVLFDAPQYHRRPCKDDPKAWDNGLPRDVAAAKQACRTTCPVFDQCKGVIDSGVQIDGVVAGELRGAAIAREVADADTRRAAVQRRLAGESTQDIAESIGYSRAAVQKWIRAAGLATRARRTLTPEQRAIAQRFIDGEKSTDLAAETGAHHESIRSWARAIGYIRPTITHGDAAMYKRGCRCGPCSDAKRASRTDRQQAAS